MIWIWTGFVAFVLLMLTLDLGVFHRHARTVSLREAMGWAGAWVVMGLGFTIFVYFAYENHWGGLGRSIDFVDGLVNDGRTASVKYVTGYIVEESLSADNMFVIAMIFRFFAVPPVYQHRVLFWGIMGALIMRGVMIGVGAALVVRFHWILYVFGVFLVFTAVKMLMMRSGEPDPNRNVVVRLARRLLPVTTGYHGQRFFVRAGSPASSQAAVSGGNAVPDESVQDAQPGALMLTPLALALIVIETTDVIFAVDSIPAIFAITADTFLVYTSNVFAVLGLRSLYSALAGLIDKFRYLRVSLAVVLALIGVKMLTAAWLKEIMGKNFNFYLLGVVLLILAAGVVSSWLVGARNNQQPTGP